VYVAHLQLSLVRRQEYDFSDTCLYFVLRLIIRDVLCCSDT